MALPRLPSQVAEERDEMVNRAIFLDRDGVINANVKRDGQPVAPTMLADFQFIPGVREAIFQLKSAGFAIIVVTNQPDVATGRTPRETVEAMHAKILEHLPVDDIKTCYHVDADSCACRKPKPGMLLQVKAERGIELSQSYLIGDRWRDIEAGRAAGCLTILVDYGYQQSSLSTPDKTVTSVPEAVAYILTVEQSKVEQ